MCSLHGFYLHNLIFETCEEWQLNTFDPEPLDGETQWMETPRGPEQTEVCDVSIYYASGGNAERRIQSQVWTRRLAVPSVQIPYGCFKLQLPFKTRLQWAYTAYLSVLAGQRFQNKRYVACRGFPPPSYLCRLWVLTNLKQRRLDVLAIFYPQLPQIINRQNSRQAIVWFWV